MILNKFFDREQKKIAERAAHMLNALRCANLDGLGAYVAKLKLLVQQINSAGQMMPIQCSWISSGCS